MKNTRPALLCIGLHTQPKPIPHLFLPLSIRHPNYPPQRMLKALLPAPGLALLLPDPHQLACRTRWREMHSSPAIPTTPGKDNTSVGPAPSHPGAAPSQHCPIPALSHPSGVGSFLQQCPGQPGGVSMEETFNYTALGVFPVAEGRLHSFYLHWVPLVLFDN